MSENIQKTDCNKNETGLFQGLMHSDASVGLNQLFNCQMGNTLANHENIFLSKSEDQTCNRILESNLDCSQPKRPRIQYTAICESEPCIRPLYRNTRRCSDESNSDGASFTNGFACSAYSVFKPNWDTDFSLPSTEILLGAHASSRTSSLISDGSFNSSLVSKSDCSHSRPVGIFKAPLNPVVSISVIKLSSNIHASRIHKVVTIKLRETGLVFSVTWDGLPNTIVTQETWNTIKNRKQILRNFLKKNLLFCKNRMADITNKLMVSSLFKTKNLNKLIGKVTDLDFDENLLDSYFYVYINNKANFPAIKIKLIMKKLLQKKIYLIKRNSQLKDLMRWTTKIDGIDTKSKIRFENNIDLASVDHRFKYIKNRIPLPGYKVNEDDPPLYCSCNPCNHRSSCCGSKNESEFAYTSECRLKRTGIAIYECNNNCKCGPECNNRVVQHGRVQNLCIFRTTNGMGWGVKAENKIKTGAFICEYVGEVIYSDAAEVRGMQYDGEGFTYLFDLDFDNSELYTIDGYEYGNVSRFINHSCDPNLEVCPAWVGCLDPNMPRLGLFTNKDIEPGEQLTIDYKITFQDGEKDDNIDTSLLIKRRNRKIFKDSISTTPLLASECLIPASNISANEETGILNEMKQATRKSPRIVSVTAKKEQIPKLNQYPTHLASRLKAKRQSLYSRSSDRIAGRRSFSPSSSSVASHTRKRVRCLCKSANCRKYLF